MREVSDLKTVIKSIRRHHVKTLTKAAFQIETAVTALGYTTDQTANIGPGFFVIAPYQAPVVRNGFSHDQSQRKQHK